MCCIWLQSWSGCFQIGCQSRYFSFYTRAGFPLKDSTGMPPCAVFLLPASIFHTVMTVANICDTSLLLSGNNGMASGFTGQFVAWRGFQHMLDIPY